MASFVEAAEFGIERHDTYDPGVSAERTETQVFLLEISARIRACFIVGRFFRLLHTLVAKVECAMHAYLQSFAVDWSQVGDGRELVRAVIYLHYD